MKGKKVLVTGGAGFIGSHLCQRLIEDGNEVVSIDNYFTGTERNHIQGIRYYPYSTDGLLNSPFVYEPSFDIVYHLGEYSRVEQSFNDIRLVHKYNTQGTFQILEYVRDTGAKLIYAGSSTKFSDNGADASPYAFTKAQNTQLVMNYGEWFGIDYAITYFYNVYGGREIKEGKYATLIALFKEQMKQDKKLKVVSPGTQERNFTHIDDIIDALVLIGEQGEGDGYGISSDKSYSILEVARMFGGEIEMLPERLGNRMSGEVVTEKTKALGWRAKHNLKDYINEIQ
jgi:UDP-glucose 4-epimerase